MSRPARIVTGVRGGSAPVVTVTVVPSTSASQPSVWPTPTAQSTAPGATGRCTTSRDSSMACCQPPGMRFQ